ncbi:MAG TPA: helix-turn-helix transcriptional regulator [Methylophilaceae bacterium]|nr:helix-turn-helix transcriptional regulator [Methylophilaceae bacterium]
MFDLSIYGKTLKDIRTQKGISQQELAFMTELDRTYISMLERNLRQPSLETVFKISVALGFKASEFIALIETTPPQLNS